MTLALLLSAVLAASTGTGVAPRPVVQAAWTASAGGGLLHGNVSAQASSEGGNAVLGSWTLVNADGIVTVRGTWSGKKVGASWRGTWRASVAAGGTFAGTWQAVPPADFHGRTFEDLWLATASLQMSGYWTSKGGGHGAWWLKGASP